MARLAHDVSHELRDPHSGKWARGGAVLNRMVSEAAGGHEKTHAKVSAIQPGQGKNIGGHWIDRPAHEGGKYRVKLKTSDRGKRDVKVYDNPEDAARAVHAGSHASPGSERAAREVVGASPSPESRPSPPAAPRPSPSPPEPSDLEDLRRRLLRARQLATGRGPNAKIQQQRARALEKQIEEAKAAEAPLRNPKPQGMSPAALREKLARIQAAESKRMERENAGRGGVTRNTQAGVGVGPADIRGGAAPPKTTLKQQREAIAEADIRKSARSIPSDTGFTPGKGVGGRYAGAKPASYYQGLSTHKLRLLVASKGSQAAQDELDKREASAKKYRQQKLREIGH